MDAQEDAIFAKKPGKGNAVKWILAEKKNVIFAKKFPKENRVK